MKLIDVAIILIVIFMVFMLPIDIKQHRKIQANRLEIKYNDIIDNATNDAAKELFNNDEQQDIDTKKLDNKNSYNYKNLNIDKALWRFYQTLYINMNIENDKVAQMAFEQYIPVALVVGYDGYYIYTTEEVKDSKTGSNKMIKQWKPKKLFTFFDKKNNIIINLSLEDYSTVHDCKTNQEVTGTSIELSTSYPNSIFNKDFDFTRRKIITDMITDDLNHFTNKNNNIARQYGYKYEYTLPYVDQTAINNISFMAFIQGIPLNGTDYYNNYSFGISDIKSPKKYWGNIKDGRKVYHTEKCKSLKSNDTVIFKSRKQAVSEGYYPDIDCEP